MGLIYPVIHYQGLLTDMIREKYDQYSKQFVADLLGPQGEAHVNYEITPGKAHHAEVYFVPAPNANFQTLGLLGKIAASPCLIEPFRNQPSKIGGWLNFSVL